MELYFSLCVVTGIFFATGVGHYLESDLKLIAKKYGYICLEEATLKRKQRVLTRLLWFIFPLNILWGIYKLILLSILEKMIQTENKEKFVEIQEFPLVTMEFLISQYEEYANKLGYVRKKHGTPFIQEDFWSENEILPIPQSDSGIIISKDDYITAKAYIQAKKAVLGDISKTPTKTQLKKINRLMAY